MSRDVLVVGINRYQHLPELKAPAVDAEAIARTLSQHGDFNIARLPEALAKPSQREISQEPRKYPTVAKTRAVSSRQLKAALKQLFLPESKQAPETALFYFSGHGIADTEGFDKGYLATSDTDPNVPALGISMRWLQWLLAQSPVKQQIVWLDCCHSGSLMVDVGAANPGDGESRDRCFIASSRDFESSWEDLNSPYSVLTRALLEGLDPTQRPERGIDTFSLVDFVNQALKGELQRPVCTNFGEAINLTREWRSQPQTVNTTAPDTGLCPYKGLEFFDCNDEDPRYFFGRERLVSQLLDRVRTQNFMALVGASGSGKSSVLRAGLLHQLELGRRIAGSEQWRIRITRPDAKPMQNLALAFVDDNLSDVNRASALSQATALLERGAEGLNQLVQASAAPRTILVVDQFEEVFTRCEKEEDREQFFACLMGALAEAADRLCLIIAMRADFVGKCLAADYSGLAQQIPRQIVSVLPMESKELEAAICKPAEAVGLQVEPALVTEILNDISRAPGNLPLLQYTLKALWQQKQNSKLQLSTYQALGGINGTLDRRATEIYNSFSKAEQQTVQHIFQQLTQLGEGTEDTRRRVFQADLVAAPKHSAVRVQQVIDRLASKENRLLVTSEVVSKNAQVSHMAIVDVAHEALIRSWKLLRQWIEQNRDLLRKQRKIEAGAVAWRANGKPSGYLLQGLPLIEAIQIGKQQAEQFPLSDSAQAFVRQSRRQRRRSRVKVASWLILPALFLVGVVEYNLRERGVKEDYVRLGQEGTYGKKQAAESLVQGCSGFFKVPYVGERLFGNCRSLHGETLTNANFRAADFRAADFISANLISANLMFADLSSADFISANLSGANLISTNLSNANLSDANLVSATLVSADLSTANLSNANLSNADLSAANLIYADLRYANLRDAYFRAADLRSANLSNTNLRDAYFRAADLSNANLSNTNLSNANLSNANFILTILLRTILSSSQGLTQEQLTGENQPFLCDTLLPEDINVDKNRDCDKLAVILHKRYPNDFDSEQAAQSYVDEQRRRGWEESP